MSVGEKIKELRTNTKISQTELAEAIGVTKQTIYKYENSIIINIPHDKIEAIANFFNVTPAYLLSYDIPHDYVITIGDTNFIIEYKCTPSSHDDPKLKERLLSFGKFIYHNPEYCDLIESIQKVNKNDIPFLIELIDKLTR